MRWLFSYLLGHLKNVFGVVMMHCALCSWVSNYVKVCVVALDVYVRMTGVTNKAMCGNACTIFLPVLRPYGFIMMLSSRSINNYELQYLLLAYPVRAKLTPSAPSPKADNYVC